MSKIATIDGVYKEWSKTINHFGSKNKISLNDVDIELFEVSNQQAALFNLHCSNTYSYIEPCKYVRLKISNILIMSDTPYERLTNQAFVNNAHGNVLIVGLGIGLLLKALIPKLENGEISHISVWEKNDSLIKLWNMAKLYLPVHDKISIFHYDVFEYKQMKKQLKGAFDSIYIDIWAELNEDAYAQMKLFRRAFRPFLNPNNPNAFIECWGRKECVQKMRKKIF